MEGLCYMSWWNWFNWRWLQMIWDRGCVATISISSSSLHYHGCHYLFIMVAIITISIITINHPCHEEMFWSLPPPAPPPAPPPSPLAYSHHHQPRCTVPPRERDKTTGEDKLSRMQPKHFQAAVTHSFNKRTFNWSYRYMIAARNILTHNSTLLFLKYVLNSKSSFRLLTPRSLQTSTSPDLCHCIGVLEGIHPSLLLGYLGGDDCILYLGYLDDCIIYAAPAYNIHRPDLASAAISPPCWALILWTPLLRQALSDGAQNIIFPGVVLVQF